MKQSIIIFTLLSFHLNCFSQQTFSSKKYPYSFQFPSNYKMDLETTGNKDFLARSNDSKSGQSINIVVRKILPGQELKNISPDEMCKLFKDMANNVGTKCTTFECKNILFKKQNAYQTSFTSLMEEKFSLFMQTMNFEYKGLSIGITCSGSSTKTDQIKKDFQLIANSFNLK